MPDAILAYVVMRKVRPEWLVCLFVLWFTNFILLIFLYLPPDISFYPLFCYFFLFFSLSSDGARIGISPG